MSCVAVFWRYLLKAEVMSCMLSRSSAGAASETGAGAEGGAPCGACISRSCKRCLAAPTPPGEQALRTAATVHAVTSTGEEKERIVVVVVDAVGE